MFLFPNAKNIPDSRVDDFLKFSIELSRQVTNEKGTVVTQGEQQRLNEMFMQTESCDFPEKV